MSSSTQQTSNHDTIELWIKDRDGLPATVATTAEDDRVGILRVWFPGQGSGDQLDKISWEDFFAKFEQAKLAFLYETKTKDESLSRFCKFISR